MPDETNLQRNDSARLLSVANAELTDSGRKVTAWFFETPQIFEFSMDIAGAENMLAQLKQAGEMQLPVNVYSTSGKGKNTITQITPASEAQLKKYKADKALREPAVPVPPPKNE